MRGGDTRRRGTRRRRRRASRAVSRNCRSLCRGRVLFQRHTLLGVNADRVVIAELAGGAWTSGQVDNPISRPLRVLAQGTKARVVYERFAGGFTALYIRTQA